ncbi:hypothetical protein M430DRAFT_34912 [Amorphotheca resinae ATCC 22711]|jgi:hypothetical protein|uniref:Uncharacterized protein n=1 Tax=Amorphotheca resinae ATCC 22711 TaxID=857342 RepID=A0A2T3B154_AMORE|nr:hypothetical protein M430DRAFT_34912 [Amorphotheca resinae ATCC 22711]PSS18292.1 hypothetical protein M430DRAFT_34912 [Amorphotheca resinae ATCC 22711]
MGENHSFKNNRTASFCSYNECTVPELDLHAVSDLLRDNTPEYPSPPPVSDLHHWRELAALNSARLGAKQHIYRRLIKDPEYWKIEAQYLYHQTGRFQPVSSSLRNSSTKLRTEATSSNGSCWKRLARINGNHLRALDTRHLDWHRRSIPTAKYWEVEAKHLDWAFWHIRRSRAVHKAMKQSEQVYARREGGTKT